MLPLFLIFLLSTSLITKTIATPITFQQQNIVKAAHKSHKSIKNSLLYFALGAGTGLAIVTMLYASVYGYADYRHKKYIQNTLTTDHDTGQENTEIPGKSIEQKNNQQQVKIENIVQDNLLQQDELQRKATNQVFKKTNELQQEQQEHITYLKKVTKESKEKLEESKKKLEEIKKEIEQIEEYNQSSEEEKKFKANQLLAKWVQSGTVNKQEKNQPEQHFSKEQIEKNIANLQKASLVADDQIITLQKQQREAKSEDEKNKIEQEIKIADEKRVEAEEKRLKQEEIKRKINENNRLKNKNYYNY